MHTIETRVFIAIVIASVILFIFLAFFVTGIIRYYRISVRKQREKITADLVLLEEERSRLSADLHDEMGMLISTIKITLHCLDVSNPGNLRHLKTAEELIDQLMQKVRSFSADLMPLQFTDQAFEHALQRLMDNISSTGLIALTYRNNAPPMSLEKKLHVYRLIQEITNNTIKHAEAHKLSVELCGGKKMVILKITDDGKGFDKELVLANKTGIGFSNIRRRVETLHAKLYLETEPGKGTHYRIEIPN